MGLYGKQQQWNTIFETASRFGSGASGTATATFGVSGVTITKGTDGASGAYIQCNTSFDNYAFFSKNPEWTTSFATQGTTGNTWEAYIQCGNPSSLGGVVDPNTTQHMGFRVSCANGVRTLYSTSSDGTTAVETVLTLVSGSMDDRNTYYCKMISGSNIDFYVNGNLLTTHTTHLPTGGSNVFAGTIHGTAGTTADLIQIEQAAFAFDS